MKFGNYNITTSPKERSRKFDIFRFSKIKSTTNNFVDRFQSKIETFRRLKSRSESPLSFRASLFERDGVVGIYPRPVHEKFSPKDFPKSHYRGDNFYVFGNTIRKLSDNQKSISGRNSYMNENFYCTLRTNTDDSLNTSITASATQSPPSVPALPPLPLALPAARVTPTATVNGIIIAKSHPIRPRLSSHHKAPAPKPPPTIANGQLRAAGSDRLPLPSTVTRHSDAIDQCSSIASYIERELDGKCANKNSLSRNYTNSLKDILDTVSHLDEDTEFKVLKDYFETNSYSDIVRDSAFKDYLNRKNYNDILDYLNDDGGNSLNEEAMRLKLHTPMADDELPSHLYDNATDNSKLYKWKSTGNLYESLSSYNNNNIGGCGGGVNTSISTNNNNNSVSIQNSSITNNSNSNHVNHYSNQVIINKCMNHHSSLTSTGFDGFRTVDRLETSTYRRQRKPPAYIGSTTSLNRRTNSKILQRQRERENDWRFQASDCETAVDQYTFAANDSVPQIPPPPVPPNPELKRSSSDSIYATLQSQAHHYEDVKRFCDLFLTEHYTFNNKWSKFDASSLAKRYTDRQYKKLITKFIKSKGYTTSEEYVQAKFGTILDRSIPKNITNAKTEKLDLPKTYIDNVQRRYQVTKQHFLNADRFRSETLTRPKHNRHDAHNHSTGQSTLTKSNSFDYKSAIDRCTSGCCMTIARRKRDKPFSTGSLPSVFRSHAKRDRNHECFNDRSYLENSNCDIYCSSCMLNAFPNEPYRGPSQCRASHNFNEFSSQMNLHEADGRFRGSAPTLLGRPPQPPLPPQPPPLPPLPPLPPPYSGARGMHSAPDNRPFNRHNQYNHLHPTTAVCSNYVNFRKFLLHSFCTI